MNFLWHQDVVYCVYSVPGIPYLTAFSLPETLIDLNHHIIISGFGIYGAVVVPDSGVGNT